MTADARPRVLFVYHTFSQQTGRAVDAMADALAARNCEVTKAAIEFPDPKWQKLFAGVPMRHPMIRIPTILVAQRTRQTGEIRIPPEAQEAITT